MPNQDKRNSAQVRTFLFGLVVSIMEEQGKDPTQLLAGTDLSLAELVNPENSISFDQAVAVFSAAQTLSGDPGFGLTLGTRQMLADWGLLGYALSTCGTLSDSIRLAQKYAGATTAIVETHAELGRDRFQLFMQPRFLVGPLLPFAIEEAFSSTLKVISERYQQAFRPLQVDFAYDRPAYADRYAEVFNCPLAFNQPANCMSFALDDVERPLPLYNPVTAKMAEQMCERDLQARKELLGDDLARRIYREILRRPGSFPSAEQAARACGISRSTMSRELKRLGTSFQTLLDEARHRLAVEYLQSSALSLDEIAALVGYSDTGNFYRAFKRWTGQAPSAFRGG